MSLKLTKQEILEIKKTLDDHLPATAKAFIFGSRVTGDNRKYSDVDLGIEGEVEYSLIGEIEDSLNESQLPFLFDVVDFSRVNDDFRAVVGDDKYYLSGDKENAKTGGD